MLIIELEVHGSNPLDAEDLLYFFSLIIVSNPTSDCERNKDAS